MVRDLACWAASCCRFGARLSSASLPAVETAGRDQAVASRPSFAFLSGCQALRFGGTSPAFGARGKSLDAFDFCPDVLVARKNSIRRTRRRGRVYTFTETHHWEFLGNAESWIRDA